MAMANLGCSSQKALCSSSAALPANCSKATARRQHLGTSLSAGRTHDCHAIATSLLSPCRRYIVAVRASQQASETSVETASASIGQVTEVSKDTFWPIVEANADKVVVLDMYTQWCGPCKIMYPKLVDLSKTYNDVLFLKLDCNQDNKPLAKELGVRVVPTFKVLKNKIIVSDVKGAKYDELVQAIEKARES